MFSVSVCVDVLGLRGLLPFVRNSCAAPSCYHGEDQDGVRKQVWQHEGGEQGDLLMPLLFSLAVHDALSEVKDQMLGVVCISG